MYWHDWCVTHGRYDATASAADPDHRPAGPGRWFWKTTEGLVNDDLLRLWGEKKVRAAVDLLETKGYAQSRFNPKNRYDRTKQYRLVPTRLAADLKQWSQSHDPRPPEGPDAFGENAECVLSMSCEPSPIRQKRRIETAEAPDFLTETTKTETTLVPDLGSVLRRVGNPRPRSRVRGDGSCEIDGRQARTVAILEIPR
ncbi:MAG TPA: hypothetical protein VFA33_24030 [Bryobacteraceae bacterium]|nr:hypothetical protein [Bryobacteraceae bacterium]